MQLSLRTEASGSRSGLQIPSWVLEETPLLTDLRVLSHPWKQED